MLMRCRRQHDDDINLYKPGPGCLVLESSQRGSRGRRSGSHPARLSGYTVERLSMGTASYSIRGAAHLMTAPQYRDKDSAVQENEGYYRRKTDVAGNSIGSGYYDVGHQKAAGRWRRQSGMTIPMFEPSREEYDARKIYDIAQGINK